LAVLGGIPKSPPLDELFEDGGTVKSDLNTKIP
jgi:hypothetical protein